MNKLIQRALLNALGTGLYVVLLISLGLRGEKLFGTINNNFAPIAFLLTFVTSAAITAGLVLGKPILMYLDGQKKEAVKLFMYTIGWLAVETIIVLIIGLNIH